MLLVWDLDTRRPLLKCQAHQASILHLRLLLPQKPQNPSFPLWNSNEADSNPVENAGVGGGLFRIITYVMYKREGGP